MRLLCHQLSALENVDLVGTLVRLDKGTVADRIAHCLDGDTLPPFSLAFLWRDLYNIRVRACCHLQAGLAVQTGFSRVCILAQKRLGVKIREHLLAATFLADQHQRMRYRTVRRGLFHVGDQLLPAENIVKCIDLLHASSSRSTRSIFSLIFG